MVGFTEIFNYGQQATTVPVQLHDHSEYQASIASGHPRIEAPPEARLTKTWGMEKVDTATRFPLLEAPDGGSLTRKLRYCYVAPGMAFATAGTLGGFGVGEIVLGCVIHEPLEPVVCLKGVFVGAMALAG